MQKPGGRPEEQVEITTDQRDGFKVAQQVTVPATKHDRLSNERPWAPHSERGGQTPDACLLTSESAL